MKYILLSSFFTFILYSCSESISIKSNTEEVEGIEYQIDSIKNELSYEKQRNMRNNVSHPCVSISEIETPSFALISYEKCGLIVELTNVRPIFNNKTFFCVPLAYTSPRKSIDGMFILKGNVINSVINNKLTGFCIISNYGVTIGDRNSLSDSIINGVVDSDNSLFQQTLLINNSSLIDCDLFGEKENLRRAIIKYQDVYYVVESHRPVTIREFQKGLLEVGVLSAINLDMGTYSEGWYKDENCNKIKIGEKMWNTNLQTNWLVFRRYPEWK